MPALARLSARLRPALLLCALVSVAAAAQIAPPAPQPLVHYHFGDDLRFADPSLDDSAWPIAPNGQIPLPPFHSDGYVWVRARIPVRATAEIPLSVLFDGNENQLMADELYVNGALVGQQGSLAPTPAIARPAEPAVFGIPVGAVTPGASALVAFRAWYVPGARFSGSTSQLRFTIDSSRFARLARSARHQRAIISIGPQLGANLIITCFGLGLFLLWRRSGGRDILLCAALLLLFAPPGILSDLQAYGVLHIPLTVYVPLYSLILLVQMSCLIEFIWTIHAFRNRFWKRLAQAALLLFTVTVTICVLDPHPSLLVAWSVRVCSVSVYAFDAIAFAANLWALLVNRRNQLIAASLALIPLSATLGRLGFLYSFNLGPFHVDTFNFAFLLSALALFIMLGKRAWTAWGEANHLRVEFDAAREVQERLVITPPLVPGFRMESAYIPATQVGGDFYHIRPDDNGGVLIAVGDVSGKGLRAAMAVSAIVGALRAMPLLAPSRVLFDLNRGLAGNLGGGFVTCCVTHIAADGKMIIANAGHLPPYRNGQELPLSPSLPLGLAPDGSYTEASIQLNPGDTLTFLSDGVVEARNPRGELYGFDRTQKIARHSAEEIARAAQAFGQEDDITVLTLAFTGAEVLHA
jgi:phosphoserine phosphatase RsbU/P